MKKKIKIPTKKYIQKIEINDNEVEINFSNKKKVALLFICVNERYWPYLKQVVEDCQKHFLPHHLVDYFLWTDIPKEDTDTYKARLDQLLPNEIYQRIIADGSRPNDQWWPREVIQETVNFVRGIKDVTITETEPIEWPAPTLMRYHLFLQQEEKLKDYDYVFYLDADMRVVDKISDEILGEGLTAAEHPMYALRPQYIPPYEPNKDSTAYIKRLGTVVDDGGKPRFKPHYLAGGFQGGVAKNFIAAMKRMKANIDIDFNNNYTAIWNDESHWNKYLWDYRGPLTVLSPSYVYPDSLINEYYIPVWGKDYPKKIITLTKPFSLSKQAGSELNQFLGVKEEKKFQCPHCLDMFDTPGMRVNRVVQCPGKGQAHQLDMTKTS